MSTNNKQYLCLNKDALKHTKKKKKANEDLKCELCNKQYKTERGFLFHMCENKRRLNQKDELYSRIAFTAYLKFYQVYQKDGLKKNPKSYEDFIKSSFYSGFIKFGHYVSDMKMVEPDKYIEFLIFNEVPLKDWTNDKIFNLFIKNRLKNEKPDYAIERSIRTIKKWAEKNNLEWFDYFNKAGYYRIVSNVRTGKISPWLIYNTKTGKEFINTLDDKQVDEVFDIIDPSFWKEQFNKHKEETRAIKEVFRSSGI